MSEPELPELRDDLRDMVVLWRGLLRSLGMAPLETAPADAVPLPDYRDRDEALTGVSLRECPACHQGRMLMVEVLAPGGVTIADTS